MASSPVLQQWAVENPEIFVKTPGAHLNVLSRKNLSIQPVSSPEQDQTKKLLM
jgi:hypothetical protein